jgi:hypothetical protein
VVSISSMYSAPRVRNSAAFSRDISPTTAVTQAFTSLTIIFACLILARFRKRGTDIPMSRGQWQQWMICRGEKHYLDKLPRCKSTVSENIAFFRANAGRQS